MFLLIDTNSGGLLSQKEFIASAAILVTFGIDLDEPEAVYKQLDKDGSGSINFEEFVEYALNKNLDLDGIPDDDD